MWNPISWILKKPADLDLHCFLKQMYLNSSGQGLIAPVCCKHNESILGLFNSFHKHYDDVLILPKVVFKVY